LNNIRFIERLQSGFTCPRLAFADAKDDQGSGMPRLIVFSQARWSGKNGGRIA
jgi:hypothetical protein